MMFKSERFFQSALRSLGGQAHRKTFVPRATGYHTVSTKSFEEETMPAFSHNLYFPVRLGDIFHNRYQVVTKLGFGSNSTVWLCLDQTNDSFVALKVYICKPGAGRERQILTELANLKSKHHGSKVIRSMLDSFEVTSESGNKHVCLVHEPLLMSLQNCQDLFPNKVLPPMLFKIAVRDVLIALDFLHMEARMIHTDIQASNIMMGSSNPDLFSKLLEAENNTPSERKVTKNYTIYKSRSFTLEQVVKNCGPLMLSDFGETRTEADDWHGLIQPDPFRAPEVILGMPWTSKTDIWNVGVMSWRLFEDHLLFEDRDREGRHSSAQLLAHITAILGPAPLNFIAKSQDRALYWNDEGKWTGKAEIPDDSLEESDDWLVDEDMEQFAIFIRKMLQWNPEHRKSTTELLQDKWLLNTNDYVF